MPFSLLKKRSDSLVCFRYSSLQYDHAKGQNFLDTSPFTHAHTCSKRELGEKKEGGFEEIQQGGHLLLFTGANIDSHLGHY
jgi:hypothetical protein